MHHLNEKSNSPSHPKWPATLHGKTTKLIALIAINMKPLRVVTPMRWHSRMMWINTIGPHLATSLNDMATSVTSSFNVGRPH